MGPISFADFVTGSDVLMDSGENCASYRINVVRAGYLKTTYRGSSYTAGPDSIAVYRPEGDCSAGWATDSRILGLAIDRRAVENALSDALGRPVTSQIEFTSVTHGAAALSQSWTNMVLLLRDQYFRPDSVLHEPLVGAPFLDSLVHGFLLAIDHPHRAALAAGAGQAPPRAVRVAIDVIESEAHLPTTVTSLAARSNVSVRSLQQGFRSYLGVSPMEYLRNVRLRRAHQALLEADPSESTVASIAFRWGFGNLGRFAAAHADRYGEPPSATLHRRTVPVR